jgi:hypothetical protein
MSVRAASSPAPGVTYHNGYAARHAHLFTIQRAAHLLLPRTTPGRLRAGFAATALLACLLAAAGSTAAASVGGDFQSIGQVDAPEINASTGLYFALNDMDAQVANVLLVSDGGGSSGNGTNDSGSGTALASARSQDLAAVASDRATADADLQQAAVTDAGNAAAQRELRSALDGLGQYEALAADAMLADQPTSGVPATPQAAQASATASRASTAAVDYERQATDLMQKTILPEVSALTAANHTDLDSTYAQGRSGIGGALALVILVGAAGLIVLVALQAYLARRFHRTLNPAIAAATLLMLAVVIATAARLSGESGDLYVAKVQSLESLVPLDQARALSYDVNADESRYLIDPARAAQYEQAFLSKSRQLANVGNVAYSGYGAALASDIARYQRDNNDVVFGGYFGDEFRNITFPGERAAAVRALLAYQAYQGDDRTLRALATHDMTAAAVYDTGTSPGQSDGAFNSYAAALDEVIAINQRAYASALAAGESGATAGSVLPPVGAALVVILVFVGLRPRFAEYRGRVPARRQLRAGAV